MPLASQPCFLINLASGRRAEEPVAMSNDSTKHIGLSNQKLMVSRSIKTNSKTSLLQGKKEISIHPEVK